MIIGWVRVRLEADDRVIRLDHTGEAGPGRLDAASVDVDSVDGTTAADIACQIAAD